MISSNHYKYCLLEQDQGSSRTAFRVVKVITLTIISVLAVSSMLVCIFQASSMHKLSERIRALEHSSIKKDNQVQEFSRRDKLTFPVYGLLVRINESINAVKSRQDSLEHCVKKINTTPYSNCNVEIYNSTCNHTTAGKSILESCSTSPVPLEVEVSKSTIEVN